MRTFLKILVVFLIIGALVAYAATSMSFSEGDRAGTVSKFSNRGYVLKTWEGELLQGGFSGGTGQLNAEKWLFSVESSNPKTIDVINEALRSGKRITLKYEEKFFVFPWKGDTKYLITEAAFAE